MEFGVDSATYAAANPLNQYPGVDGAALSYDPNGNLTNDGSGGTYTYDAENRLLTAVRNGNSARYAYDPLGHRSGKTVNGTATYFLGDAQDDELADYDGGGTLLRRYVPGPGLDQPIAVVTATGTPSYFHSDRQGSVIAMSGGGSLTEGPYTYDAYGNGAPSTGEPFKYTGRRLDAETGLYYYRARYYSPSLGRFLQTDPIGSGDDLNLYAYTGNDPVNRTDPSGNCPECLGALIGGGLELAIQLSTPQGRAAYATALHDVAKGDVAGAARAAGPSLAKVAISAVAGATGAGIATKVGALANAATQAADLSTAAKVAANVGIKAAGNGAAGAGLGAGAQAASNAVEGKPLGQGAAAAALGGAAGGALSSAVTAGVAGSAQGLADASGNFVGTSTGTVAAPGATITGAERAGAVAGAAFEKGADAVLQSKSRCNPATATCSP